MRALISVSDKTGIQEFAKALVNHGYDIISTGGTANVLRDAGVNVISIDEVTGSRDDGWSGEDLASKDSWWLIGSS